MHGYSIKLAQTRCTVRDMWTLMILMAKLTTTTTALIARRRENELGNSFLHGDDYIGRLRKQRLNL